MSTYQHYIRHLGRDGVVKNAVFSGYSWVRVRRSLNREGRLSLGVPAESAWAQSVEKFDLLEFWWKNDALGIAWHMDFEAIVLRREWQTNDSGLTDLTVSAPGQAAILNMRQVAWPAGTDNRARFSGVPAETIMKTLVTYNFTSAATVGNGRIRAGDMEPGMGWRIVVAADAGGGNALNKAFANGNVGRILKELPATAGGDWSFIRTPVPGVPARWVFEFYPGQRGADKSSGADKVEFSLERGNMINPSLSLDSETERTVSISGGQGAGDSRYYEIVTGPDYAADNDIEMYSDARQDANEDVTSMAEADLEDARAVPEFSFVAVQTDAVFYSPVAVAGRKTYDLGDRVAVSYTPANYVATPVVSAIEISVSGNSGTRDTFSVQTEFDYGG